MEFLTSSCLLYSFISSDVGIIQQTHTFLMLSRLLSFFYQLKFWKFFWLSHKKLETPSEISCRVWPHPALMTHILLKKRRKMKKGWWSIKPGEQQASELMLCQITAALQRFMLSFMQMHRNLYAKWCEHQPHFNILIDAFCKLECTGS